MPFIIGLPLTWVAFIISPVLTFPQGNVFLLWLPVTACTSLMMAFGFLAVPGMFIGMLLHFIQHIDTPDAILTTATFIGSYIIAFALYLKYAKWRGSPISGALMALISRLIFLVGVAALLPIMLLKLTLNHEVLNDYTFNGQHFFHNKLSMITLQAEVIALLACGNFTTLALRIIRKPLFLRVILAHMKKQQVATVKPLEKVLWLLCLASIIYFLCDKNFITSLDINIELRYYAIILLLPLLMTGAIRYGYHFVTLSWAVAVFTLFNHPQGFINVNYAYGYNQFIIICVLIITFSFALMLMATNSSRQRRLREKLSMTAFMDPVFYIPNLRALERDMKAASNPTICYVHVSGMEALSRGYGMSLRIHFKQQIISGVNAFLESQEKAYHLPGYDIALLLKSHDVDSKLVNIQNYMNSFRLSWEKLSLHPNIGISYYSTLSRVTPKELNALLGELSSIAEQSITIGKPERKINKRNVLQLEMEAKINLLNRVQHMLDTDGFLLMAQPIIGYNEPSYYEILLRMPDGEGGLIPPNKFLPVVDEFGLSYQLDLWVLEHTLKFLCQHRDIMARTKFSINFTPATLCATTFSARFIALMQEYGIEPTQIVLEVTESHHMENLKYADKSMQILRQFGCQVAIDDFGTGYASYQRVKMLQSDILKIDGSFIRDVLSNPLDSYIVKSICEVARMKQMKVVAEYVENREQVQALSAYGVDYCQGFFMGKPVPLNTLLKAHIQ